MSKYKVGDLVAIKDVFKNTIYCERVVAILEVKQARLSESEGTYMYATENMRKEQTPYIREDEIVGKVTQLN